jgi:lipid-binding SYLF domain-containing protein
LECCRLFEGVWLLQRLADELCAHGRTLTFPPVWMQAMGCGHLYAEFNHSCLQRLRSGKDTDMKKITTAICTLLLTCLMLAPQVSAASSREDLQARIEAAKTVLDQIMGAGDRSVPMDILQQATCVAVVPGMIKGAFVFGAQYGQGVVTCRTGHGWSAPVFIRMAGGSWGLQIGGQSTDLILIAVNERGFQDLLKNKFKIGGDASAAAGPVGRSGTASTDWKMGAELLSYSRTKGLFAGIDLDGTSVSQNSEDTEMYFGGPHRFEAVLKGEVAVPPGAVPFVKDVAQYFVKAKEQK